MGFEGVNLLKDGQWYRLHIDGNCGNRYRERCVAENGQDSCSIGGLSVLAGFKTNLFAPDAKPIQCTFRRVRKVWENQILVSSCPSVCRIEQFSNQRRDFRKMLC